jgi:hypothetical protein
MNVRKLLGALAPMAMLLASPAFAANTCVAEANVAPDNQTVAELTTVTLNASPSKPNGGGDPIAYLWTQISGPPVTLSSTTAQKPTFLAPDVGPAGATVRLNLRVTGCSPPLVANVTTDITITNVIGPNTPPFASASVSPQPAQEGMPVTLSSAGSSDPEGATLTYLWQQLSGPSVTLSSSTAANPTFTAPNTAYPGGASLVFRLTVSDGSLTAQAQTTANIVWVDDPPTAALTCSGVVNEGQTITLNGAGSSDTDDGIKSYTWAQVLGPPNIDVSSYTASSISFPAPVLGIGQEGFVPFRLVVTDFAGQTSQAECTVQIKDVTKPLLTGATDRTVQATSASGATVSYTVDAYDNVDGASLATCVPASPSLFAFGDSTVNCSRNDSAGNVGTASFTIHVVDSTGPVIATHDTVTVEATSAAGALATYTSPGTTDAVDPPGVATCAPASGTQFALATTPVYCNATDSHGNAATQTSFNVIVQDATAPAITPPADVTVEATGALTTVDPGTATANDLVGPVTITRSPVSNAFPVGANDITWTATDAYQNFSIAHSTVTVTDTAGPSVTDNGDQILEATSAAGAVATFDTPTATDLVDGSRPVTCSASSGDTFPLGPTTVTCSASDSRGNTGSSSFTITVQDTTAPVIGNVSDVETEATGPGGAIVLYVSPMSTDAVDGAKPTSCSPDTGTQFVLGDTTVTCSATDAHNNSSSKTFKVTVTDKTPPVVTVPANMSAEATGPTGAVVTFGSSASDIVDGTVTTSCLPASGSVFALGATSVTCSATDAHLNKGTNTFTVTVVDTTPPVVTVPANVTVEATGAAGAAATFTASALDLVDGSRPTTCVPASGSTFAIGTTTVTCSASDTQGNGSNGSFTVTVEDSTPPTVADHADVTVEATGPGGAIATFTNPVASDIVDGSLGTSCVAESGSLFAMGDTTVTCTATDAHSNAGSKTFQVHVVDTTAPELTSHSDVSAEATGPSGASVGYALPTASDLVDGTVAVGCVPASGSTFAVGNTTVACTATDGHGNTGHGSFVVHVLDTTAPVVANHDDVTVEATSSAGAIATFTKPTASDLVDVTVPVACSPASGTQFALGNTPVSCSATDAHGNKGSNGFAVHVVDTTAPTIAFHEDVTAIATSGAGALVTYTVPTASDLVDGSVTVTCSPASGTQFAVGSRTVTCSATDSHGNTATSNFKVIVSYNFTGFFKPVDNLGIVNVVKAGQAIPVKFSLGGNMGLNIFAANYPASGTIACTTGPVDAVEETVTAGGSALSYDATTGQYIYVWKTDKAWAATCRQLVVKLADGTSAKVANFNFTR